MKVSHEFKNALSEFQKLLTSVRVLAEEDNWAGVVTRMESPEAKAVAFNLEKAMMREEKRQKG